MLCPRAVGCQLLVLLGKCLRPLIVSVVKVSGEADVNGLQFLFSPGYLPVSTSFPFFHISIKWYLCIFESDYFHHDWYFLSSASSSGNTLNMITEVNEFGGVLNIGSHLVNYMTRFVLPSESGIKTSVDSFIQVVLLLFISCCFCCRCWLSHLSYNLSSRLICCVDMCTCLLAIVFVRVRVGWMKVVIKLGHCYRSLLCASHTQGSFACSRFVEACLLVTSDRTCSVNESTNQSVWLFIRV